METGVYKSKITNKPEEFTCSICNNKVNEKLHFWEWKVIKSKCGLDTAICKNCYNREKNKLS